MNLTALDQKQLNLYFFLFQIAKTLSQRNPNTTPKITDFGE